MFFSARAFLLGLITRSKSRRKAGRPRPRREFLFESLLQSFGPSLWVPSALQRLQWKKAIAGQRLSTLVEAVQCNLGRAVEADVNDARACAP
jgi:hypothetical protein